MRRVGVTGIGLVTALGVGTEATWTALLAGRSAIGTVRRFDASSLCSRLGAEVTGFDPAEFGLKPRSLRMMTLGDQFAFAAASLALREAGWNLAEFGGDEAALYAGGNKDISNPDHFAEAFLAARRPEGGADMREFGRVATDNVYPLFYVEGLPASALFFISEAYGMTGANSYFAGTAEAGMVAIAAGARAVARGEAAVALAGGFDETVTWWNFSKLDALGILSDRHDLGAEAFRPYDRERTGSVLGDGAAFLALEDLDAARARGAHVYAEVAGFGAAFDNHGLLSPEPHGREVGQAIGGALRRAGLAAEEVGCVVAHGSATRLGDPSEVGGIRSALGDAAGRVVGCSVKASTGHLVAAAGALNAAVAALAVDAGTVPPTLNLDHVDPECELDWNRDAPRRVDLRAAVAIARGIEGQAGAMAIRAVDG